MKVLMNKENEVEIRIRTPVSIQGIYFKQI